jgi:GAF domain-containing protein
MDAIEDRRKLLHNFAALADLGQEIAETNNFQDMVRSSLHLLLGALAIRRGALAEYREEERLMEFASARGTGNLTLPSLSLTDSEVEELRLHKICRVTTTNSPERLPQFISSHRMVLEALGIDLILPLVVRGNLLGLILLGGKASDQPFTIEDEIVCSMARHIGVGLHTHRLIKEVERRALENLKLYDGMRETYKDTVRAFAAAIDCRTSTRKGIPNASASTAKSLRANSIGAKNTSKASASRAICMMSANLLSTARLSMRPAQSTRGNGRN